MTGEPTVDRRSYIKAAGAVGLTGVIAGCTDDGGEPTDGPENGGEETDDPENGGEETDGSENGDEETNSSEDDQTDGGATMVLVGPEDQFIFEPEELTIDIGTAVEFVWESDTHNIAVVEGPDDGWEGHETIEDAGFTHEHTFEVEGTYDYVCEPHESQGMVGTVVVQ